MNTIREAVRRLEEDFTNVRVLPQENQAPPKGNQVLPQDQSPLIPQHMMDGEIMSFLILYKVVTNEAQLVATKLKP